MSKKYHIFIVDNEEEVLKRFKSFLSEHQLYLFSRLSVALDFIDSPDFALIDVAILDDEIGKGIKIGGLNLAYKIVQKKNSPAVILCDSRENSGYLKKMATIIDVTIYEKPIEPSIVNILPDVIAQNKMKQISDFEQSVREFITGVELLKEYILTDSVLNSGLGSFIKEIQKVENSILPGMNFFLGKKNCAAQNCIQPDGNKFRSDIQYYVRTLTTIVETLLTRNYHIPTQYVSLFQEIDSVGKKVILELDKIKE